MIGTRDAMPTLHASDEILPKMCVTMNARFQTKYATKTAQNCHYDRAVAKGWARWAMVHPVL